MLRIALLNPLSYYGYRILGFINVAIFMRPTALNYLFTGIDKLTGIGPQNTKTLNRLLDTYSKFVHLSTIPNHYIVDLLYHLPNSLIDRRHMPPLYGNLSGQTATFVVTVTEHISPKIPRQPYQILCKNDTGCLKLIFFKTFGDYLIKNYPVDSQIVVSGRVDYNLGHFQMVHPDLLKPATCLADVCKVFPIYPLVNGSSQTIVRQAILQALKQPQLFPEWIDDNLIRSRHWLGWFATLEYLHAKLNDPKELLPNSPYLERLAYDELLASQLAFKITRQRMASKPGNALTINRQQLHSRRQQLLTSLPFALTAGQQQALEEIEADLSQPKPMLRLLQGDVGSGKTIIALLAMMDVVDNHKQAAIIAPLSILARQHLERFQEFCRDMDIRIELLTSKVKGKKREKILMDLQEGKIDILIGTHSLIQDKIQFKDLGFIVIDEQHRFGVLQRISMVSKGKQPDILLMTATPIPRTLLLSLYNDLSCSVLTEKPANRQTIKTTIVSGTKLPEVYQGVQRLLKQQGKVFWICPLITENPDQEVKKVSAEERFDDLQKVFGNSKVALIHGKLKPETKEEIMQNFSNPAGEAQILVATTVIEVGIDVPSAVAIIIENAENFGLAQLHQLRGRVGRGDKPAFCVLLHGSHLSDHGRSRLETLKNNDDGFAIAEADLKLRGGGKILGLDQSGYGDYVVADLRFHQDLIKFASQQAREILDQNPTLEGSEGEKYRILLHLFRCQDCLELIDAG